MIENETGYLVGGQLFQCVVNIPSAGFLHVKDQDYMATLFGKDFAICEIGHGRRVDYN